MAAAHYLLVANPTAQSGRARDKIAQVQDRMEARAMAVRVLHTAPGGKTVELVQQAIDDQLDTSAVIYFGGDGTFAEVASGILAASRTLPLGMLPAGTANDQGRSFGISSDFSALDDNLRVIQAGHLTQLDVGRVGRVGPDGTIDAMRDVFHSVGWGQQPDILAERNRDRQEVRGIPLLEDVYRDQVVYAGAALKETLASYFQPTKFDADVIADGQSHHYVRLLDLIVNATPVYGGAWVFDRSAEPDDGRFELVPIAGRRDLAFKAVRDWAHFPLQPEDVDAFEPSKLAGFSAAELDLRLRRPGAAAVSSQVDGEEWVGGDHFRLTVLPRRLPVITPASFEPPWR